MCCRRVSVCPSVCPSQGGIVSIRLDESSSGFCIVAYSTYPTLCYNKIWVSSKWGYFPLKIVSQSRSCCRMWISMAGHASSHFDASIIAPSCKNTQHVHVPAAGNSVDRTTRGCGSLSNYDYGCKTKIGNLAASSVCVCNTHLCNDGSQSSGTRIHVSQSDGSAGVRQSSLSHVIITISIAMSAIAASLM